MKIVDILKNSTYHKQKVNDAKSMSSSSMRPPQVTLKPKKKKVQHTDASTKKLVSESVIPPKKWMKVHKQQEKRKKQFVKKQKEIKKREDLFKQELLEQYSKGIFYNPSLWSYNIELDDSLEESRMSQTQGNFNPLLKTQALYTKSGMPCFVWFMNIESTNELKQSSSENIMINIETRLKRAELNKKVNEIVCHPFYTHLNSIPIG